MIDINSAKISWKITINEWKVNFELEPCSSSAAAYSDFHSMKRVGVSLLPPWVGMPILCKATPLFQPPPPRIFHQAPLRIRWYPFILLVRERHCENNLSCLRIQECSTMTQSGLEPRPFDAEFSALTVRLTVIETWKRGRYLSELIKVLNIFSPEFTIFNFL